MALIVEDGTGKPDAESYIDVAGADDYHAKRGNADWALLTLPDKEAALRKGWDFMLQQYRQRWAGYRFSRTQSGDWPREEVPEPDIQRFETYNGILLDFYPDNTVPPEVKNAQAELAFRSTVEDLTLETERLTTGEAVGSIRVSYDRGAADKRRFPMVEGLLRPFFKAGGAYQLVRG